MKLLTMTIPKLTEADLEGMSVEQAHREIDQVLEMMKNRALSDNLRFTVSQPEWEGQVLENYEALVASRFYIDGDLVLGFTDGFFFNVGKMVEETHEMLERI